MVGTMSYLFCFAAPRLNAHYAREARSNDYNQLP